MSFKILHIDNQDVVYEDDLFQYICSKYIGIEEIWKNIHGLYKFDSLWNIVSTHEFIKNYYISNFGRIKINNVILNNKFDKNKIELVNYLKDKNGERTRFKRYQVVCQTFLSETYRNGLSPDHINRLERYDNSIFNLRWANRDVQCCNRNNESSRRKQVICLNDNQIYDSCTQAEKELKLPYNTVASVARKIKKSIRGYEFKYVDNNHIES